MGNDISYSHFEGHEEIAMALQQMNPIAQLQKMLNTEETHFNFASQYIDSTYVIPLSVGLPLNLAVRGNIVADVRGALKTDLKSLFQSGKGDVLWKLHPSAVVSLDASMSVDAVAASGKPNFCDFELVPNRKRLYLAQLESNWQQLYTAQRVRQGKSPSTD